MPRPLVPDEDLDGDYVLLLVDVDLVDGGGGRQLEEVPGLLGVVLRSQQLGNGDVGP